LQYVLLYCTIGLQRFFDSEIWAKVLIDLSEPLQVIIDAIITLCARALGELSLLLSSPSGLISVTVAILCYALLCDKELAKLIWLPLNHFWTVLCSPAVLWSYALMYALVLVTPVLVNKIAEKDAQTFFKT
jgi:hypothetical protein